MDADGGFMWSCDGSLYKKRFYGMIRKTFNISKHFHLSMEGTFPDFKLLRANSNQEPSLL